MIFCLDIFDKTGKWFFSKKSDSMNSSIKEMKWRWLPLPFLCNTWRIPANGSQNQAYKSKVKLAKFNFQESATTKIALTNEGPN